MEKSIQHLFSSRGVIVFAFQNCKKKASEILEKHHICCKCAMFEKSYLSIVKIFFGSEFVNGKVQDLYFPENVVVLIGQTVALSGR